MSLRQRALDPELAALRVLMPDIDITDSVNARALEHVLSLEMRSGAQVDAVDVCEVSCARHDGSQLNLRVYRPRRTSRRRLPALLFLHGGSFVTGSLETEHTRCADYCEQAECLVVSVDYRLAPEHPFPAGFEDCCTAFAWMVAEAQALGIDRTRLAVGGLSAGGALAVGIAARERDTDGEAIALQMLLFPVLDASMSTLSARSFIDTPILASGSVASMWQMYLGPGGVAATSLPRGYASPADLQELSGLPPTFLCTAEFDPLRDEGLLFAQRLLHADVPVELHHYARAYHSFDSFKATRMATVARRDQVDALRTAFS